MIEIEKAEVLYPQDADTKEMHLCESRAGHELLCNMLKKYFGIVSPIFGKTDTGKPYLCNEKKIFFNISHTKGRVICAVSDKNVGVDIEKISNITKKRIERISKRFFTQSEYETLKINDYDIIKFFTIWTKKEAYIKMNGKTLAYLKSVDTDKLNIATYIDGEYIISVAKEE